MPSDSSANAVKWYDPGVYRVESGVHRIVVPLPNQGLRAVNVYVIEDADGPVLIDAGWSVVEALDQLKAGMATLGYDLGDVQRILITHMHHDHYTLAVAVRRLFGTRIEIGIGEQESLERVVSHEDSLLHWLTPWGAEVLREAMSGQRDDRDEYELPDAWILGGTDIELGHRTLQAVPTPGHTRGHLVFADAERSLLFSGDHILPTITPSIGLEPVRSDDCLSDFLRSLQLIAAMPDMQVLPAHGMPDRRSQARAAELLDHHERRLKSTLDSVTADGNSPYEVAGRLAWTRAERGLHELDTFNQYLAAGETAAHLDLLLRRGQVTRTEDAGVRSYRKAPTPQTSVAGDGE